MEYRRVGASGLRVSSISIGGWLTFGGSVDDDATSAILGAAVDGGINFIDLADVYARGESERAAGKALARFRRDDLVISSKLFWPMSEAPNDRGLSRKHIHTSIDRTLRNLGTDYLDIYFCHREDPETPLEETARAMDDLIRRGKILYWGTSMWKPRTLRDAHALASRHGWCGPQVEQPKYNLLDRSIEKKLAPTAAGLSMGLVVWSPLAGGILTGKYAGGVPAQSRGATTEWLKDVLTPQNIARVGELAKLAQSMSLEPGQLALAWVLRRPEVSSAITGATQVEHVQKNLRAASVQIPADVLARLEKLFPG
ncbi:MAG: aldo/keto reductase family protein [Planctomycetota bacterium]